MEDKKKLNILIFSWRGPGHPHAGGAEKSTHEHAKGWVKAGHRVTLFTSCFPGAKNEEAIDGVKIIRQGLQIFGVQLKAFYWYIFNKSEKYDLVIDQFHGIPFFTPLYVRVKKLAFIHEVTKEVWGLNPWPWPFNLIPAIIGTILEPLIFKLLYKNIPFMTVSDSTKKDLISWGIPEKSITVIHNGLNTLLVKSDFPKEKKRTLIFLAALSKDKGIEDAIRTFYYINKQENNWQFWIAGKGEEHFLKQLKLQVKKLNMERKIKFWGYVSDEEKFELLSRAHILINSSIREGWGFVVMEAASVGTPTVGYDVPGLRDSIIHDKTGLLCNSNPNDCAEAILSLMNDKQKYRMLGKNCVKWSKKFEWDKSVEISLRLLERLVFWKR